ncbi:hypothetical protein D3C87_1382910 [compost metagenome]
MFKPVVYNARDTALYDFSARTAFLRVDIAQPYWSNTEDHLVEGAAQIRRHIDDVDAAVIQYEDFAFLSKDGQREYETRAECIIGEAIAASEDDIQYKTTFEMRTKRNDKEEFWSRNSYATFDEVVVAAFDNQHFEANPLQFTVQQEQVIRAVRQLRSKQGTK